MQAGLDSAVAWKVAGKEARQLPGQLLVVELCEGCLVGYLAKFLLSELFSLSGKARLVGVVG